MLIKVSFTCKIDTHTPMKKKQHYNEPFNHPVNVMVLEEYSALDVFLSFRLYIYFHVMVITLEVHLRGSI